MRRPRNQHRSRTQAAQAALEKTFSELYSRYGDEFNCNLQDAEQAWRAHDGPMGLEVEEFQEAATRFLTAAYLRGNGGRDGK